MRYDEVIATHPIDFQVLGIGENGHIGFNEPGTSFDVTTHVVDLTPSTISANQRYLQAVKKYQRKRYLWELNRLCKVSKLFF